MGKSLDAAPLDQLMGEGRLAEAELLARRLLGAPECHGQAVAVLARIATAHQEYGEALRWVDRASRLVKDPAAFSAWRGVLLLASGEETEAIRWLLPVWEQAASAAPGIALGQALLQIGEPVRAAVVVAALLRRFPVSRTPGLVFLADQIVASDRAVGWVGHDGGHTLCGALRDSTVKGVVTVCRIGDDSPILRINGASFISHHARRGGTDGLHRFAFTVPPVGGDQGLVIDVNQSILLGAPLHLPFRDAVEGVVEVDGAVLRGWAWLPAEPTRRLSVTITDTAGRSTQILADQPMEPPWPAGMDDACHGFALDLDRVGAMPGRLWVSAEPDGVSLIGSPIDWIDRLAAARGFAALLNWLPRGGTVPTALAEPVNAQATALALAGLPVPVAAPPRRFARAVVAATGVDVVVPVYRGHAETLACLRSVLDCGHYPLGTVIVVNDACPEPALVRDLTALAAAGQIMLLTNANNLGFPASVNRGMMVHADRDVVLLNADTLVAGDWLWRLRTAAYLSHDIGTVTPLSNDAEILSYPSGDEARSLPTATELVDLDQLAGSVNAGQMVDLPTAVGFCMYIRRDCLVEVGAFDTRIFDRGYGEENDFCMRARRLGWRHVGAADVFVAHLGGRSFGRHKALLQARNRRILEGLHPGYEALVAEFIDADPLAEARKRLDLARWCIAPISRPAILLVTLALNGGVSRHVEERQRALSRLGQRVLVLRPVAGALARCRIEDPDHPDLRDMVFRTRDEIEPLVGMLARAGVCTIEYHHTLHHDPIVLDIPQRLGVPYDVVYHDYSWICPRIALIDGNGHYCGEPREADCDRCVCRYGAEIDEEIPVASLRQRSAAIASGARRRVAPTRDVADRLGRYLGPCAITVEPWDDVVPGLQSRPGRFPGERWRVCLIGAIGMHKGYQVLLDCARNAAARRLPLEFVVVGYTEDDYTLFATGRVFITGRYAEDEAVALVQAQRAQIALFPSVCPETWCYALSVAWRAGLDVVGFDIGAVAERIRRAGQGRLLPSSLDAGAINDALLSSLTTSRPGSPGVGTGGCPTE